jgi:hypothetical protein
LPPLIPTLPPDLAEVPEGEDFFPWRERLLDYRNDVQWLCEFGDAEHPPEFFQALEYELCSQDIGRWIALWLWIEEPRLLRGEDPIKPFVPFAFQVELAQWWVLHTSSPDPYDGFVSKSRGLGASWIFAACATWAWLFRPWRGILISRKEDLVDKRGDLNSLFGKVDFILEHLSEWMLPEGFDFDRHRMKNFLQHPSGTAALIGEATTAKSTRGGRATFIIYDEAAFIAAFLTVFGTGSGTTNHRWAVSSESFEEGSDWWDMWHKARERDPGCVRELNWRLNPYFTEYWYAEEKARWEHDPEGFEREYERNPFSDGTWIYPIVRFIEAYEEPPFPESPTPYYDPAELLLVGIDPGRADDTAIVFMQFGGDGSPRTARWLDSYSNHLQPAEYYAHVLTGIEPAPGDTCWGLEMDSYALNEIMPWMRSLPWEGRMRLFCDPAGGAKDMSGKSFTDRIMIETKKLRTRAAMTEGEFHGRRPVPIVPLYEELFAANRHDKRRYELRKMLMHCSFAPTRGAKRFKYALEQYRFSSPGNKSTAQPAPQHDVHSHLCSAAEYLAVYCSIGMGRIKPARERKKAA